MVLATNDDLDHPEHVLSLVRRSDASVVELGRSPGELTPAPAMTDRRFGADRGGDGADAPKE